MNLKRLLWTAALRGALPIRCLFAAEHYEQMFYRPVLGKIDARNAMPKRRLSSGRRLRSLTRNMLLFGLMILT